MTEHFVVVSKLERAIARGHLDDAHRHARWIDEHDEAPQLVAWRPFVDEMRASARAIAETTDLPTAGVLAARLAAACSDCHVATHAVVTFAWEPVPDEAPVLQVQMRRHEWAAERLWEGLVGPSDALWREGTSVLATAKLDTVAASSGASRGDVLALANQVRQLARRATTLSERRDRATLFGELLSTCAGCHQLVRPTTPSGR
ncbi:MAG: hypothetical protein ABI867_19135 [Kofleriaceae bacterium]